MKEKYCPVGAMVDEHGESVCMKEQCGWWYVFVGCDGRETGKCALAAIAQGLNGIASNGF